MNNLRNVGPNIDPWGTPEIMELLLEIKKLKLIQHLLNLKHLVMQSESYVG